MPRHHHKALLLLTTLLPLASHAVEVARKYDAFLGSLSVCESYQARLQKEPTNLYLVQKAIQAAEQECIVPLIWLLNAGISLDAQDDTYHSVVCGDDKETACFYSLGDIPERRRVAERYPEAARLIRKKCNNPDVPLTLDDAKAPLSFWERCQCFLVSTEPLSEDIIAKFRRAIEDGGPFGLDTYEGCIKENRNHPAVVDLVIWAIVEEKSLIFERLIYDCNVALDVKSARPWSYVNEEGRRIEKRCTLYGLYNDHTLYTLDLLGNDMLKSIAHKK